MWIGSHWNNLYSLIGFRRKRCMKEVKDTSLGNHSITTYEYGTHLNFFRNLVPNRNNRKLKLHFRDLELEAKMELMGKKKKRPPIPRPCH